MNLIARINLQLIPFFFVASSFGCQGPSGTPADMQRLAMQLPPTDGPVVLSVRSDVFEPGTEIPEDYTAYGIDLSPPLRWSGVPETAKSIAIVMEDPDVKDGPFVHWVIFNIPATTDSVRQSIPPQAVLPYPAGALHGTNSAGKTAYFGPKPPAGAPVHHYHFEVFALDTVLKLSAGASRTDVVRAMAGHVVGKGEIVGTYRQL